MPSKAWLKNLAVIEAIASVSVPTTGYDAGTRTVIDRTTDGGSENAIGCGEVELFANISSGPAADTALDVYVEWSEDGTNYFNKEWALTIPVSATETGLIIGGVLELAYPYAKLYMQAPGATLTASLHASPKYYEGQ